MNRYDFPIAEWCRTIWVSTQARALWEPRIARINTAWLNAERSSVGVFRHAARQTMHVEQFAAFAHDAVKRNLVAVPLSDTKMSNTYQAAAATSGAPGYHVLLARDNATARMFIAALNANDERTIGTLLGFPDCCSEFFEDVWTRQQFRDTTWAMSQRTNDAARKPIAANILLRWIGVRFVPHLPCSFNCVATESLGEHFMHLLKRNAPQEAAWMHELLDAPIEWSAKFGIAEIKHPLFKISTKTDAIDETLVVRRDAQNYPELGAQGNAFPYRRHIAKSVVHTATFVRPSTDWTDNGFTSLDAMNAAHKVIIDFVKHKPEGRLLDLGCGNGALAARLAKHAYGIEADAQRYRRASKKCTIRHETIEQFVRDYESRMLQKAESQTAGATNARRRDPVDVERSASAVDVASELSHFDTVLLMPGRLLDMSAFDAWNVRRWLQRYASSVVLYAYGDQLHRCGGFDELCDAAKLPLKMRIVKDNVGVGLMELHI